MQISTMGVDLAKSVFQVHGVDAAGEVVVARKLRRAQVVGFFAGGEEGIRPPQFLICSYMFRADVRESCQG